MNNNQVPSYSKPQLVDRGTIELLTKDHPGTVNPENEGNDNIVWGNFAPESPESSEAEE